MTNYELYLEFIKIASSNPFDAYMQLKELNKKYKKSQFYKATKMRINKAYQMFLQMSPVQLVEKIKDFANVETWSDKITELINGIDEEAINKLVDRLTSVFDIEKLQDEKGDLKILLNQVKDLVAQ